MVGRYFDTCDMSLMYITASCPRCFSSADHSKNKKSYTNPTGFHLSTIPIYLLPPFNRHTISIFYIPIYLLTMADPVSIFITAAVLPLVLATIQGSLQLALDAMPEIHDKRNRRAMEKLDALFFKAKKGDFAEKGITLNISGFPPPRDFKS